MPRIKVRKGRASPMVMHKEEMKRKLQSRLKFLLRFLNADVESLNSVELLKLFLDFGVFIYGIHDFAALRRIAGEGMDVEPKRELVQERKYLKVCQDFFRFLLDGFLGDEVSPGGSHPRFDTMTVSYSIFIHNDKIRKLPIHPKLHLLVLDLPEHLHEDGEIGNF
jgi:hypothetical protein